MALKPEGLRLATTDNIYTHKRWTLLGYGKMGKKTCHYVFELENDTARFTTIKSGLSCLFHLREYHLFIG